MKKLFIKLSSIIATLTLCFSTTVFGLGSNEAFAEEKIVPVIWGNPITVPASKEMMFSQHCKFAGLKNLTCLVEANNNNTEFTANFYDCNDNKITSVDAKGQAEKTFKSNYPCYVGVFNKANYDDTFNADKSFGVSEGMFIQQCTSGASTLKVGLSSILALIGGIFFLS